MANRTLLLAVVVCLTALPVRPAAQTPTPRRGKWWQAEDVQHELGLTSTQVDAIEKVWRRDLDHRVELRRDLDALQARWNDALEQGEIDDADAQKLIDQVEQARMERNKARTFVLLEMYRVLTPDQRSHLGAVLARRSP
ncbi:MAG TPA: Spy/CpxP family protein refolding chaperone, partial [Vicinamibacterales bacterium]|nr:Spy/CpxP family protein refolding chaperone [Vicinamibacterales bacterium]